jgi:hypothetical protein
VTFDALTRQAAKGMLHMLPGGSIRCASGAEMVRSSKLSIRIFPVCEGESNRWATRKESKKQQRVGFWPPCSGRLQGFWPNGGIPVVLVRWVEQLRLWGNRKLGTLRRCDQGKDSQGFRPRWFVGQVSALCC